VLCVHTQREHVRASARSSNDLIIAAIGATVFATLGVCAHDGLLDDMNHRVRRLLLRRGPDTVRLARAVTLLSESAVHPVLGFLLSKAASRAIRGRTYVPLAASLANFVLNKGTRLFVHQERPPGAKPRTGLDRLGYPSGHTLAATAIAFSTALRVSEGRPASRRTALLGAAAVYAATIGWTRLTLDEHWIDDVVGAWAGGIALAILVTRADSARRAYKAGKPQRPRRRSYSRDVS
jgi:membrane-associated phospholipid phosphatase